MAQKQTCSEPEIFMCSELQSVLPVRRCNTVNWWQFQKHQKPFAHQPDSQPSGQWPKFHLLPLGGFFSAPTWASTSYDWPFSFSKPVHEKRSRSGEIKLYDGQINCMWCEQYINIKMTYLEPHLSLCGTVIQLSWQLQTPVGIQFISDQRSTQGCQTFCLLIESGRTQICTAISWRW